MLGLRRAGLPGGVISSQTSTCIYTRVDNAGQHEDSASTCMHDLHQLGVRIARRACARIYACPRTLVRVVLRGLALRVSWRTEIELPRLASASPHTCRLLTSWPRRSSPGYKVATLAPPFRPSPAPFAQATVAAHTLHCARPFQLSSSS